MNAPTDITVLLVEGTSELRTATSDLLASLGYRVLACDDFSQAEALVRSERIDAVVANAYPARGDGLAIVDRLRAIEPSLPAVLLSGFGDDLELRRRVVTGDVGFLAMPFSLESLSAALEEALERLSVAGSPALAGANAAPPRAAGWTGRARPWLAAAGLLLAIGLFLEQRAPEMPAPELGGALRGQFIELVEPVGEVGKVPTRLSWHEAEGAVRYRVVLRAVDDTPLWTSTTDGTSVELPEAVVGQLQSAVSYHWQVEGLAEDLSRRGRSNLVTFSVRIPGPA